MLEDLSLEITCRIVQKSCMKMSRDSYLHILVNLVVNRQAFRRHIYLRLKLNPATTRMLKLYKVPLKLGFKKGLILWKL